MLFFRRSGLKTQNILKSNIAILKYICVKLVKYLTKLFCTAAKYQRQVISISRGRWLYGLVSLCASYQSGSRTCVVLSTAGTREIPMVVSCHDPGSFTGATSNWSKWLCWRMGNPQNPPPQKTPDTPNQNPSMTLPVAVTIYRAAHSGQQKSQAGNPVRQMTMHSAKRPAYALKSNATPS